MPANMLRARCMKTIITHVDFYSFYCTGKQLPPNCKLCLENQKHLQKLNWDFKSEDTFSHQLNYLKDNSSHPEGEKRQNL